MGIFISVKLANSITQSQWQPVYEKSLLMAKKLRFYDVEYKSIHGRNILCIVPTDEKHSVTKNGEPFGGWYAVGDLGTYKRAETQFTPKYIPEPESSQKIDVLSDDVFRMIKDDSKTENVCFSIWNNKTQGEAYHMGLLAIGCMIEQELGIQAMINGDITYNQCVEAAKLASDILGYEVALPCRCRLNELHERLKQFGCITESEKIYLLMYKYLGDKDEETGKFIRSNYSENSVSKYWTDRFKNTKINTIGFLDKMKDYFLLGFGLRDFCEYSNFDKDDTEQCKEFINNILETSMHIKEKDCEDIFDYTKSSTPYGVHSLLASFFFRGARNRAIDRYIPLDEMKAVFSEYFKALPVEEIIEEYLIKKQNEKPEDNISAEFKKRFYEYVDEENELEEKYDIYDYTSLTDFTVKSKLSPEMDEAIKSSFEFYLKQTERDEYKEEMNKSSQEMFDFLAQNYRWGFLSEEHWNKIYDDLKHNKNSFKRYFPMIIVRISNNIEYLIRAFVTDDVFWEYCNKNYNTQYPAIDKNI